MRAKHLNLIPCMLINVFNFYTQNETLTFAIITANLPTNRLNPGKPCTEQNVDFSQS